MTSTRRSSLARRHLRGALSRGCAVGLGIGAVLLLLVLVVGGAFASKYNSLQANKKDVEGKFAAIDSQYKRRSDLIDNLVRTVTGSAEFERSTLEAITNARASVGR